MWGDEHRWQCRGRRRRAAGSAHGPDAGLAGGARHRVAVRPGGRGPLALDPGGPIDRRGVQPPRDRRRLVSPLGRIMSPVLDHLSRAPADRYRIERELGHVGMATADDPEVYAY